MKYKQYRQSTRCNNNGLLIIPVSSTCFGQLFCPKHVLLTGIINKPLLLHIVGCLYYLCQWCTIKQISDNEIYLLIKYIKSVLRRVAKRLSYIEDSRCLKVNNVFSFTPRYGLDLWYILFWFASVIMDVFYSRTSTVSPIQSLLRARFKVATASSLQLTSF